MAFSILPLSFVWPFTFMALLAASLASFLFRTSFFLVALSASCSFFFCSRLTFRASFSASFLAFSSFFSLISARTSQSVIVTALLVRAGFLFLDSLGLGNISIWLRVSDTSLLDFGSDECSGQLPERFMAVDLGELVTSWCVTVELGGLVISGWRTASHAM